MIAERYGPQIEALYDGSDQVDIEVQVTYEDGGTGMLRANLQLLDTETYQPLSKAG
ncbi:MAG: hypothetical protein LAT50_04630 [Ectothiorhodospiraceae bacterium]|nr:hypothetical protein [Ectothiorhodospiraceae bacterium]